MNDFNWEVLFFAQRVVLMILIIGNLILQIKIWSVEKRLTKENEELETYINDLKKLSDDEICWDLSEGDE